MRFVSTFLEALFPTRPDYRRVQSLTVSDIHSRYAPIQIHGHLALSSFADPDIRACVHECKYHENANATALLAGLLRTWLKNQTHSYVVVPVPLSRQRQRKRGYNQVTKVAKVAGMSLDERVLLRTKDTTPQTQLDKAARRTNVRDIFAIHPLANPNRYRETHLLLLDDVTTTGTTLSEAAKTLRALKPASLTTIALAH